MEATWGVWVLLLFLLGILWEGVEGAPTVHPPHTPRQFTTWPFLSPFPPKYKHIRYPCWWSQGCREVKSSSPSWSLAPLIQMDGISYPIPVIHFSSSLPFSLCWPPAWPLSLLLLGTSSEACLLRWLNSAFRSWYSQLTFSWSPVTFLFGKYIRYIQRQ